jgi:hypothetical protein
MMRLLLLISFFSFHSIAHGNWTALNAQSNKLCSETKPCYISHENGKVRHKIVVHTLKNKRKLTLKKVSISSGQKSQSFADLENFPIRFVSESYEFFAVDLNQDGHMDLALRAAQSLSQGHQYFYWVYNPKMQSFVLTNKQLPRLNPTSGNKLKAVDGSKEYQVNEKFEII